MLSRHVPNMGGGMLRGFPGTWVGEGRWGGEVERGKEEEAGWVMGGGRVRAGWGRVSGRSEGEMGHAWRALGGEGGEKRGVARVGGGEGTAWVWV